MSTRTRGILIAVLGFVLILAAAIFVGNIYFGWSDLLLNAGGAQTKQAAVKTSQVVVVTSDKFLGDPLAIGDLTVVQAPVELIPRDAVTKPDDAVGKFIKADMAQGQMILSHMLADPTNKNHDLSFILSDDHILFAFPAVDVMSREGVIQRGDIIDIFATLEEEVKQPGTTTTAAGTTTTTDQPTEPVKRSFTLNTFQRISVTALIADIIPNDQKNPPAQPTKNQTSIRTYLLALNPQDALVLKHLLDNGAKFDMALRAPTSTKQFDLTPVTKEYIIELYGLEVLP